jgi:hypothetical protein
MNRYATWFSRAMWAGILADIALGLPAVFAPDLLLGLVGARPSQDPIWTSFAALLLVILPFFYIPGAIDPYRHRFSAWGGVLARPPGVFFFLILNPGVYPMFGILDAVLFTTQLTLLLLALQHEPDTSRAGHGPRSAKMTDDDIFDYDGSSFADVRDAAFAGRYEGQPPVHPSLGVGGFLRFLNGSSRNLSDRRDIRPRFDKLIHANGICFTGKWKIDADSRFTGYFAKGSEGLLLVRASVAGAQITAGKRRSLGIAGKIWPTLDPRERAWPANFVTVSDLSGTRAKHITEIAPSNFPRVGMSPAAILVNRIIFRMMDTRPGYRQLFPISTLGLQRGERIVTPDLMRLRIADGTPRIDRADFRDELRLENYPGGKLRYEIEVRDFEDTDWKRIGTCEFDEYAISEGGDKRLHFWIPRDVPSNH